MKSRLWLPIFRKFLPILAALVAVSILSDLVAAANEEIKSAASKPTTDKQTETVVLSPFQVSTAQDRGYQAANTLSGFGYDTPISKLPQTLQVATEQLIQDLAANDLLSAMEVASSSIVRRSYNNGDDQFMWGFRLAQSVRDGVPVGVSNPTGVLYDIERIEAIKGPAAALFGQASAVGGLLNYVPRKPSRTAKYRADFSVGSYDYKTAAIHAAGPITNKFRYRVDLGAADNGGKRIFSFYKDKFAGMGFEYDVAPGALISVDLGRSWAHRMNSWTMLDTSDSSLYPRVDPRVPEDKSINGPHDDYASQRDSVGIKALITLPGGFSSMTSLNWTQVRLDIARTQSGNLSADRTKISRVVLYPFVVNERNTFFVQSFIKKQKTGFLNHLIGVSMDARSQSNTTGTKSLRDPVPAAPGEVITSATRWATPQWVVANLDYNPLLRESGGGFTYGSRVKNRILGGTLYDVVSFWDERIKLLFNYRFNDQLQASGIGIDAYQSRPGTQTVGTTIGTPPLDPPQTVAAGNVATKRYGGTIEPIKDVMLYYNVGEAFIFNGGLDWQNKPLVPSIGQNKEFGVKATFLDGAVAVSVSHFNIELDNVRIVYIQGANDPFPGSSSIAQGGTQTNKGFDMAVNISKQFDLGTANVIVTNYMGDLEDETGNKVQHVVNNTASVWGTFGFNNAPLKGFRFGLGANYTGERVGPATLPQWVGGAHPTRVGDYWKSRAMISYNRKHFGIQLNVDNIADVQPIVGWENSLWIHTDQGRIWKLSANYHF